MPPNPTSIRLNDADRHLLDSWAAYRVALGRNKPSTTDLLVEFLHAKRPPEGALAEKDPIARVAAVHLQKAHTRATQP